MKLNLFLFGLIDLVLRHSRPSGVRASICTRSGSLSKSVTDLREKKKQQKRNKSICAAECIMVGKGEDGLRNEWRKNTWPLILNNPT